ncbi:UDP-glucose 4-epimerase family protein [Vibrio breoganii]
MKILLTGASGFLGGHLFDKLVDNAFNVIPLLRRESSKYPNSFVVSDFNSSSDFSLALSDVDCVIHLAARVHMMHDAVSNPLEEYREVNTHATSNLAWQAAGAGVKRFIFVSSIKVNGEGTTLGKPFTSTDEPAPEDDYGLSKAEAEQQLFEIGKETGMEIVVIRPTLVYGPGVKANFASLLNLVSKGVPLPFGCIKGNRRSLVSVTNLADLIVTCINSPKAANHTFLASDDYDVSTSEMVSEMSVACGKKSFQLPVPAWCYKFAGKLLKKEDVVDRLVGSLQVDISHTKETLDWTPPQSLQDGFKETADYILELQGKK